ncbi:EpsG family protein [Fibrobacter sp. UWH5]|uniref:EpsG family protein n=1 Tax=Fibrobacter sp. UWH5 TaxID=1896211 RepID=UPI000917BA5E|nr:EpsG family protein [Fibrobacter sp. UWH5]SHL04888.1 EpsG family protein [Fibrobacter sp. UWH5]
MEVYLGMLFAALGMSFFVVSSGTREISLKRRRFLSIKKNDVSFFLLALPCALVSGLRYYVGTDYTVYLGRYHYIGSVFAGQPRSMEPLYRGIVEIGHFFNSTQVVFFITALLFSLFIHRFIVDQSIHVPFSVFLVFFTGSFTQSENIMRQMLGVSICLYALKYVYTGEMKKYMFFILIASMIHLISIIYLPMYLFYKMDWPYSKKKLIAIFLGLFLVGKMLYILISQILIFTGSDYIYYYGSSRDSGSSAVLTAVSVLVSILCFVAISDKDKMYKQKMFMLLFMLISCLVLFLNFPNANRLVYMFIPIQIVLIPNVVFGLKKNMRRYVLVAGLLILYVSFWYYYFFSLNIGGTFPYHSVLGS